jgi:hypothetical protein
MKTRYVSLASKVLYAFPDMGWNAVMVMRYAEPYHPTWSSALNCVEIFGMATVTMVVSSAIKKVPSVSDVRIIARVNPVGYVWCGCLSSRTEDWLGGLTSFSLTVFVVLVAAVFVVLIGFAGVGILQLLSLVLPGAAVESTSTFGLIVRSPAHLQVRRQRLDA